MGRDRKRYPSYKKVHQFGRSPGSDLILVVSASAGKAFAKAGPKDQLFKSRRCLSKTGLMDNSSESGNDNRVSEGS